MATLTPVDDVVVGSVGKAVPNSEIKVRIVRLSLSQEDAKEYERYFLSVWLVHHDIVTTADLPKRASLPFLVYT